MIRQPQVLRLQEQAGARILQSWPFHFVAIVKTKFMNEHPAAVEKFLAALQDAIFFIAQNPEQSAAWFAEYLRTDAAIIRKVSKEDPNYAVRSLGHIDISVTPADRTMIEKWAADAYTERMIKVKFDIGELLREVGRRWQLLVAAAPLSFRCLPHFSHSCTSRHRRR